jgi:protein-disulfide isomerase
MTHSKAAGSASTAIIGLLLILVAMTGGAFYWALEALQERDERISTLKERVVELTKQVEEASAREKGADASNRPAERINKLATRIDELSGRVDTLASELDEAGRSDEELQTAINQGIEDYVAAQRGQDAGSKQGAGNIEMSLDDTDPILGNPDARITVVEYSDMECPYCQRLHKAGTIKQVVEGSGGEVNASFRHFPLQQIHGQLAIEAAIAAECVQMNAGDEAFFAMVGSYFERTQSGGDGTGTPLTQFAAEQTGVDKEAISACMESDEARQRVSSDFETGRSQGIQSTPSMVVYNRDTGETRTVRGAVGADKLQQAVDSVSE